MPMNIRELSAMNILPGISCQEFLARNFLLRISCHEFFATNHARIEPVTALSNL
jgi:hypothetical protein